MQGGDGEHENARAPNSVSGISALTLATLLAGAALAGPKEVSGPGADPACFAPRDAKVKYLQYPGKKGPLRVAQINGYVGNTWRIQMVQTAKAHVEQPDVKPDIAQFKVVSVGEESRSCRTRPRPAHQLSRKLLRTS